MADFLRSPGALVAIAALVLASVPLLIRSRARVDERPWEEIKASIESEVGHVPHPRIGFDAGFTWSSWGLAVVVMVERDWSLPQASIGVLVGPFHVAVFLRLRYGKARTEVMW